MTELLSNYQQPSPSTQEYVFMPDKTFLRPIDFPRCRRRRAVGWAILVALSIASNGWADDSNQSQPRVSLSGSFNNWAKSDPDARLMPSNGALEVRRFFPCGTYQFKFIYDGSWDHHLGDAGNRQLGQPGQNIQLDIPQSAEYIIRLDERKKSWSLKRCRDAQHPHANFAVRMDRLDSLTLDPSLSLAANSRPITSYKWQVLDAGGKSVAAEELPNGLARLEGVHSGPAQISLTISDGNESSTISRTFPLGDAASADSVEFTYEPADLPPDIRVETVDIVGDFNAWKPGANPMIARAAHRDYTCRVMLPDGINHYKFLINGSIFRSDPRADPQFNKPDGLGGQHSGIRVGVDATAFGPPKQSHINCEAVKHDPRDRTYFDAIGKNLARFSVRSLKDDVQSAEVALWSPADPGKTADPVTIPMFVTSSRDGFDYWSANCLVTQAKATYSFCLHDRELMTNVGQKSCYPAPTISGRDSGPDTIAGFEVELRMIFETPDWAKRAVWYQIFPERFRNGDPANDPPNTVPWTHSWFEPFTRTAKATTSPAAPQTAGASYFERGDFDSFIYDRRYGGDLQGVREKLPYLRDLGVTAIYFNPIFLAESLHKYDASDYRHVDDYFGVKGSMKEISGETTDPKTWQWSKSDRVFLDFLKEAHRQGFKVIIDGVFNHTGRQFWAFQDLLKNGEKSAYVDWFDVKSFKPFHYRGWDGDDGSLPRLKHDDALGLSKPVRDHLFAVTRRWMDPDGDGNPSDGIDGWRLDVAGDININFWKDWRSLVKSINPQGYIVAELWQESREWLDGRSFDAVMNYPFAVRCQRFFVNQKQAIKPSEFDKQLKETMDWYEPQINYVLQNLFGSHDTDRVASMFMNPDLEYDKTNRLQDNGPNYNTKKPTKLCYDKMKLMVTFQMTYLGAPMIYYGDEVGMYGADDPSDRKPMLWADLAPNDDPDERIVPDVLDHHRRMIAIRNSCPALQLGAIHTIQTDDAKGIYVFARSLDNDCIVIALNNSLQSRNIDIKSPWPDDTEVIRLDDPASASITTRSENSDGRPSVQISAKAPRLKTDNGMLSNVSLAPYSAAILRKSDSRP
jgi:cyclomaltodextrinase